MRNKLPYLTKTLRGKISLWYLSSVGLIMLTIVVVAGSLFWITLQEQIDHHVHITANEAAEIVQHYRGEERDELLKNLVSAQGMTIIVLSPDGAPVLETNSHDVAVVTEHQLQKILTSSRLYQSAPVHFTESNIRFAAMPVQISAGKGILAVGYSTQVLAATFMNMILIVTGIIIFLVLPITFIGYNLLKKQLHPLESVAHQAKTVSNSSSLSKRIAISAATEELTTIQTAFNTMLAQLEKVFTSERQFFSDAAHTLKTPLAVLRSQIETSRISQKIRQELIATIDATNDTIQDLLFLSKVGNKSQNMEKVSLTQILLNIVEITTVLGEDKELKVTSAIQKNVQFKADKNILQRALGNIAHNAVSYNRPKGTIHFSLKKQSGKISIIISDTGLGIKKSDQPQLFTRFFRGTNAVNKGSGLGLAITKAVIDGLGGRIFLESAANSGTTVTIHFTS